MVNNDPTILEEAISALREEMLKDLADSAAIVNTLSDNIHETTDI